MARTVGRLTLAGARLDFLRALLLNEYQEHAAFVADWIGLIAYHERLLEALPRVIYPPVGMGSDQPEDAWNALGEIVSGRPRSIHLHFYRDQVKDLCDRWGLRCAWAPAWVHSANLRWVNRGMSLEDFLIATKDWPSEMRDAILNKVGPSTDPPRRLHWLSSSLRKLLKGEADHPPAGLNLVPDFFMDKDHISLGEASDRFDYLRQRDEEVETEAELRIEIKYDPLWGGDWRSIKTRVIEAARPQWERNRRRALEASSTIVEDTQPALRTHIRWLFLRICPQEGVSRPLGWSAIGLYKDWGIEWLTPSGVQKAVDPLAVELGIALTPLKAGRPRAFA